ncbi:uncharacterized protein LOC141817872 [Curcuma longa]|uniref:uncharacterized protein LOC141817872 n=1 Tax=Curcuma longa TaxID=136217 RepID=UPI003D9EC9B3
MDRRSLDKLCYMLTNHGKLKGNKNMSISELVISFLHIIAHNVKNRVLKRQTARSGETVSRQFHSVLNSVLRLQHILLKKPEPIPENCMDERWRWFKGCLGALDGTYINVNAPACEKPKYRTRKGEIATNVLGVCTPNMQFSYVLPGWEGSVADGRVLRDAISRRNGLKIPQGCYYLCDAGYTNGEGFLAPYRGQRYHLTEWRQGYQPTTSKEYFNMKHSQARNCIERCFGILKARWAILRDKSFYDVKTQCRIISAYCILHNFIRYEMTIDPIESELDALESNESDDDAVNNGVDLIRHCETSPAWTEWRDKLADEMFTSWQSSIASPEGDDVFPQ